MSFIRALAIPAASRRSTTSAAVSDANAATMIARSSSRATVRFEFDANRSSVASAGWPSTCVQKVTHSRSFCSPSITILPSPAGKGPYG